MRTRILTIVIASGMCAALAGCQSQKKESTASVVAGAGSTDVETAAPARTDLPTLDSDQKTKAARDIEQYKKQTGFVQIDSVRGADSLRTGMSEGVGMSKAARMLRSSMGVTRSSRAMMTWVGL